MDNINIDNIIPINNLPEYTEELPELELVDVTQITQLPLDYDSVSEMVNALCPHPDIIQKLEAAFDPVNVQEFDEDFFNQDYGVISDVSELKRALSRLIIRFDDSPKNYTKSDYDYLVTLLYLTLLFLYYNNPKGTIINAWSQTADSGRTPSEKLVRDTIDALLTLLEGNILSVSTELLTEINGIISDITRLAELIAENESAILSLLTNKLDVLTPGDNIQITGNVISATIYDDSVLSGRVSTIEGKIPSEASSNNQLADKDFVNLSIATNTATFRGTYNSVSALNSVTADNNDYAFVTSVDLIGNTLYNRYKFDGTNWTFEYSLNNSSFTTSLWNSINSGITSLKVATYDGYLPLILAAL